MTEEYVLTSGKYEGIPICQIPVNELHDLWRYKPVSREDRTAIQECIRFQGRQIRTATRNQHEVAA